jgi:hypothetical protein
MRDLPRADGVTEKLDWAAWHRDYDDPSSRLAARLRVVQRHLRQAIDERPGPIRIASMCAGEGRDVIGVLAEHPRRGDVTARLVELDPRNTKIAEEGARAAGLTQVEVVVGDAASTDSYAGAVPAEIVLACGVFGNITDEDVRRTVEYLPSFCAPGATVIWTRGRQRERDFALTIKRWFEEGGFEEIAYEAPPDFGFRVGVHRLAAPPRTFEAGVTLFRFFR